MGIMEATTVSSAFLSWIRGPRRVAVGTAPSVLERAIPTTYRSGVFER